MSRLFPFSSKLKNTSHKKSSQKSIMKTASATFFNSLLSLSLLHFGGFFSYCFGLVFWSYADNSYNMFLNSSSEQNVSFHQVTLEVKSFSSRRTRNFLSLHLGPKPKKFACWLILWCPYCDERTFLSISVIEEKHYERCCVIESN